MGETPPHADSVQDATTILFPGGALLNRLGRLVKFVKQSFLAAHLGKQTVGPCDLLGGLRLYEGGWEMRLVPLECSGGCAES
jgi:hypothetical protein